jgi:hypothetical protein
MIFRVYAATWAEFMRLVKEALGTLVGANLHLKAEKCALGTRDICVMGHLLFKDGIPMTTERLDDIDSIPFPRNARELRRFLGIANYMGHYVPQYSLLAKPFSSEVNNSSRGWPQTEMREAFEKLKRAIAAQLSQL